MGIEMVYPTGYCISGIIYFVTPTLSQVICNLRANRSKRSVERKGGSDVAERSLRIKSEPFIATRARSAWDKWTLFSEGHLEPVFNRENKCKCNQSFVERRLQADQRHLTCVVGNTSKTQSNVQHRRPMHNNLLASKIQNTGCAARNNKVFTCFLNIPVSRVDLLSTWSLFHKYLLERNNRSNR